MYDTPGIVMSLVCRRKNIRNKRMEILDESYLIILVCTLYTYAEIYVYIYIYIYILICYCESVISYIERSINYCKNVITSEINELRHLYLARNSAYLLRLIF